jgi:hypothetical protein
VDHSCDKCGASLEEGVAFCPQCSAPQIRVSGREQIPEMEVPGQAIPPAEADIDTIQWPHALPSAAQAGLIAAILMLIPLGGFGLGMIAAGVLSVLLYRRRVPAANLTPGMGARLGAVSGTLGFAIFSIFTAIEVALFHNGGELRADLLQAVQQSASRSSDPQAQQILEYLKSPPGLALVMTLGLMVMFGAFLIFSSLGGAIGAALLRRKHHP